MSALITLSVPELRAALDPAKPLTQFVHDVWNTENGLPQNSVLAIAQTPDGYLWLGTEEGLLRFDGVRFTAFDKRNIPGLQSAEVDALLVDHRGVLWMGTRGGGVTSLSGGVFRVFTKKDGLASDSVQALYEDDSGTLWIGTDGGGLSRFRDGQFSAFTRRDGLADDAVFAVSGDAKGGIWIATHGGLSHLTHGKVTNYTTKNGLPGDDIRFIHQGKNGSLWIGTNGAGLAQWTPASLRVYTTADGLSDNHIWSLFEDDAEALWIGTGGGGIDRLYQGKVQRLSSKEGFSGDEVWAIKQDVEGSLWIGSAGGGLHRLRNASFSTYGVPEGLSSDVTLGVYQDREGVLWVGTADKGVNRIQNGQSTAISVREGLPDNQVFSITEDGQGDHWFGTRHGLSRLRHGKLSVFTTRNGLPNDFIRCTFSDSKGGLWVGTREGLSHFDGRSFITYGVQQGLSDSHVLAIYEDPRDQTLWVGTGGGLNHFVNGRFRSYTKVDGMSSDVVWSVTGEPDGTLWLGTNGGGLIRWKEGKFASFTTSSGMLDDAPFLVLDDQRGSLWLSSNRGVFSVSKRVLDEFARGLVAKIAVQTFGTADGMRTKECNGGFQPPGWRLREGRLAFATMKGLVIADPERLVQNHVPPRVLQERVLVDKRAVAAGAGASLVLPPGDGQLEFQYTAATFVESGKVRFKYLLAGFDKEWTDAGTRRTAYYTNIPPGSYRFRVIACNSDGVCSQNAAVLAIELQPHFYETAPFSAALSLVGIGSFWLAYRIRMMQARAKQRKLEAIVDERTQELSRSEKKFRQLAEHIREVFWMMDPGTGAFLYISPAFAELWGFPAELAMDSREAWLGQIHRDDHAQVMELRHQQQLGMQAEGEYRLVSGVGTRWLWDRGFPILDDGGNLIRIVGVIEEITARKEAEELLRSANDALELRVRERTSELISLNHALSAENQQRRQTEEQLKAAKNAAEAASRAKTEFLANVSHELRTPMNGILGMTGLALATELNAEQAEYLETVSASANSLLGIINDILDFSSVEAGKVSLDRRPFDVRECLRQALHEVSAAAVAKGLSLQHSVHADVPEMVVGDGRRLHQILSNLLGNAVKFTNRGNILAKISAGEHSGANVTLKFCISDTGIGIPKDKQGDIFGAFTQVDGSFRREFGGTGLGLAICSQLVGLMSGRMWLESEVGIGSDFYFQAAFERHETPSIPAPPAIPKALPILVVDDNPVNQKLASRVLEKQGYQTVLAGDGRQAIEAVEAADWNFSCILMDVQMPGMDGIEATKEIRRRQGPVRPHLPIIALTANTTEGDKQLCLSAGMDAHLSKPLVLKSLLDLLHGIAREPDVVKPV